jgi:hypothetical protein
MKKLSYLLIAFSLVAVMLSSCSTASNQKPVIVTVEKNGCNLDIPSLTELVKSCLTSAEIESKLNQPNGINNVDLDNDGQTDYITVAEFNTPTGIGYTFNDQTKNGNVELVRMTFDKTNNNVVTTGNPNYYGNDYQYRSDLTNFLILSYLLSPHYSYYHSPYHYGYYPSYYRPYRTVSRTYYYSRPVVKVSSSNLTYRRVTTPTMTTSQPVKPAVSSAEVQKRSLNNQKDFQKSFTKRDENKPVVASGFKSQPAAPTTEKKGFGNSAQTHQEHPSSPAHQHSPSNPSKSFSNSSSHSSGGGHHR